MSHVLRQMASATLAVSMLIGSTPVFAYSAIAATPFPAATARVTPRILPAGGSGSNSLIAHWKLDEAIGAIAYDSSENNHHGYHEKAPLPSTDVPTVSFTDPRSLSMNGLNDVKVASPSINLKNTNTITYTAWIKNNNSLGSWPGILESRNSSTGLSALLINPQGKLGYSWRDAANTWGFDSGLTIPKNEWVFVAQTIEPTKATLYMMKNGVIQTAVNSITHDPASIDGDMYIGNDPIELTRHFIGKIDDVRVYNKALSASDIQTIAAFSTPSNLVAHWKLDETSGPVANDATDHGFTGMYENAPVPSADVPNVNFSNPRSLSFNGSNSVKVIAPSINLKNTNTITYTAWIKNNNSLGSWPGILESRNSSTGLSALLINPQGKLGYSWRDAANTWGFDSGLTIPKNQWTFVAQTIEPTKATLYMMKDGVMQTAVNTITHAPANIDGDLLIGFDPQSHDRHFIGNIDDVRVYNRSLTQEEIQTVADASISSTPAFLGNLYVTKSSSPTRSRQLLGGELGAEILRLQFHAEHEDIDVTNLVFTAEGPNASSIASDIDRLELYKIGASTPFAVATVAGCASDLVLANSMCARMVNQDLIVAENSNLVISVRPRIRSDVEGAISGHRFSLTLNPVSTVSPVRARGNLSFNTLSTNNGNSVAEGEVFIGTQSTAADQKISGNLNDVVLSKITSITNADPNANGTAIPSGTQRAIGQFKFSAADNQNTKNGPNKWTLNGLIFSVNATNVLLGSGSIKMYNKADPTTSVPCSSNSQFSGVFLVTCANLISSSMNTQIDPGTDTTFVLQASILNQKISNSSVSTLQVSLTNFSDINTMIFDANKSHMLWVDKDNASATPFFWSDYPETSVNSTSYNG